MAVLSSKRSTMTLYCEQDDLYSHRTRIVLVEKGVMVDVIEVKPGEKPEDLFELNPYGLLPTLVDRDLVIYNSRVIMEYLDERFPHPPLLPVYPVARAKARLLMYRMEQDWYTLTRKIRQGTKAEAEVAIKELREALLAIQPFFGQSRYFFDDEFTLVDCTLAPLLWRLDLYGIKLPPAKTKAMIAYMEKTFSRDSFQASLTEHEREMKS